MDLEPRTRLISLAARQGGLLLRRQAFDLGVSRSTIERRLRSGEWQDLGGGVLLPGAVTPADHQRLRAATLRLRDCVVSHQTAAKMHGLHYVDDDALVVSVPVRSTHRFPGVKVREVTDMRPSDVVEIDDLSVTTPLRTAFDLASVLRPNRYERVVEDALAAGHFGAAELQAMCAELGRRGKPGSALARRVADKFGPGFVAPASELERRFRDLLRHAGLAEPVAQFRPPWWEGTDGVVDYAYPDHQVIFELDGRRWHTRDSTREDDLRRDNVAGLHRWRVFRFTWDQVVNHPEYVIATVKAALGLAA